MKTMETYGTVTATWNYSTSSGPLLSTLGGNGPPRTGEGLRAIPGTEGPYLLTLHPGCSVSVTHKVTALGPLPGALGSYRLTTGLRNRNTTVNNMKATALTYLAGLALATAAVAGTYTDTSRITSGSASDSLWQWFIGGSVGYLLDQEEPMYHLQLGVEFRNPGTMGFHSVYLEVGYTEDDENFFHAPPPPPFVGGRTEFASIDVDIIPITLNYMYEAAFTDRLNFHVGAGVGVAVTDVSYDWSWRQPLPPPNNFAGGGDDGSDVRLYGQIFTGLSYAISDAFVVLGGVRYIIMDDHSRSIDVTGAGDYNTGIDGDVLIELGARYRF